MIPEAVRGSAALLWQGMGLSLLLVLAGSIGGMAGGAALALLRASRSRLLRLPAVAYVTLLRAVPLILVLFWLYFTLPLLTGRPVGALGSALVAFVLFESAFYCEIIRAGLGSVPAGQVLAARASGLRPAQVLRLVVAPQALRAMAPLLVSQVVILFQDTSLVYVVSLRDFLTAASVVAARDDRPTEMYGFVAGVYLVICLAGSLLAGRRGRTAFQ